MAAAVFAAAELWLDPDKPGGASQPDADCHCVSARVRQTWFSRQSVCLRTAGQCPSLRRNSSRSDKTRRATCLFRAIVGSNAASNTCLESPEPDAHESPQQHSQEPRISHGVFELKYEHSMNSVYPRRFEFGLRAVGLLCSRVPSCVLFVRTKTVCLPTRVVCDLL